MSVELAAEAIEIIHTNAKQLIGFSSVKKVSKGWWINEWTLASCMEALALIRSKVKVENVSLGYSELLSLAAEKQAFLLELIVKDN